MKRILITTIAAVLLVGCASTRSLNFAAITIGMNKQQVIALNGDHSGSQPWTGWNTLFTEALIMSSLNIMGLVSMKPLSDSQMAR